MGLNLLNYLRFGWLRAKVRLGRITAPFTSADILFVRIVWFQLLPALMSVIV